MADLRFDWDARKAQQNLTKHGVSFEEAQTVFLDESALLIADPDHSDEEERFVLMGMSAVQRTVVVCHCYREGDDVVRLVSARKASRKERALYSARVPR